MAEDVGEILTSFWVLLEPRTIVRRMVEYHVSQVKETVLITGQGKDLLHFCDSSVFLSRSGIIKHAGLVAKLILD